MYNCPDTSFYPPSARRWDALVNAEGLSLLRLNPWQPASSTEFVGLAHDKEVIASAMQMSRCAAGESLRKQAQMCFCRGKRMVRRFRFSVLGTATFSLPLSKSHLLLYQDECRLHRVRLWLFTYPKIIFAEFFPVVIRLDESKASN